MRAVAGTVKMIRKSDRELEKMRAAGAVVGLCHNLVREMVRPGCKTGDLDAACRDLIRSHGGEPAFYKYRGFPANICVSVNEEVVHGIPGKRPLQEGDIVSVDVGVKLGGYYGDGAITLPVGTIGNPAAELVQAAYGALWAAIRICRPGERLLPVCRTVQEYAESRGYSVVRQYVGHGIGRSMHEDPQVPNFISENGRNPNPRLETGLVIAIEPMLNVGTDEVVTDNGDRWTVRTADGALSAHVEHTVAITRTGFRILSLPPGEEITEDNVP